MEQKHQDIVKGILALLEQVPEEPKQQDTAGTISTWLKQLPEDVKRIVQEGLSKKDTPGASTLASRETFADYCESVWRRPFEDQPYDPTRGPGGAAFLEWMLTATEVASKPEYHSPTLTLVQASGCGKSRLVRELAQIYPVVYLCCADRHQKCYPPALQKESVRRFVFGSLDQPVHDETTLLAESTNFLRRLLHIATKLTDVAAGPGKLFQEMAISHNIPESILEDFDRSQESLLESSCEFANLWQRHVSCERRFVVTLILDEASSLFGRLSTKFRALRRVIQLHAKQACIDMKLPLVNLILLSTESRVSNFSPALHLDPSLRGEEANRNINLYPPFTFVCDPVGRFKTSTCTLSEATSLENLSFLGRPLWRAAYIARNQDILEFASRKLGCGLTWKESSVGMSAFQSQVYMIAIATASFGISFVARRVAAEELTSKGMVFLELLESDRETLWLRPVPEPILGIAAMEILHTGWQTIMRSLRNQLEHGLNIRGDLGEITARLLLLLARPLIRGWTPLKLIDLMRKLTHAKLDFATTLKQHRLAGAFTAYSHAAAIQTSVSRPILLTAILSNAFIITKKNQAAFDLVVPLAALESPDDNLHEGCMTGAFIEVKNRIAKNRQLLPNYHSSVKRFLKGKTVIDAKEFVVSRHNLKSLWTNDISLLLESTELLRKLAGEIDPLGFTDAPLIIFQLNLDPAAGWIGTIGEHPCYVLNPVGAVSSEMRSILTDFYADTPLSTAKTIYEKIVSDYSIDEQSATFGRKTLVNLQQPLETRLQAMNTLS